MFLFTFLFHDRRWNSSYSRFLKRIDVFVGVFPLRFQIGVRSRSTREIYLAAQINVFYRKIDGKSASRISDLFFTRRSHRAVIHFKAQRSASEILQNRSGKRYAEFTDCHAAFPHVNHVDFAKSTGKLTSSLLLPAGRTIFDLSIFETASIREIGCEPCL